MLHVQLDRSLHHRPYYLQIVEQVREAIATGELSSGTYLPPSRLLASELGLARRTVVLAYEELCAQGYCTSHTGRGTMVTEIPVLKRNNPAVNTHSFPQWLTQESLISESENSCPGEIDFAPSVAQVDFLPKKAMKQAFYKVMDKITARFCIFEKSNGESRLIENICQYVLPLRGIEAEPTQVLITSGSQCSAALISRLIGPCRGSISYGVPGYLEIPHQFTSQGLVGIPCSVDAEGVQLTKEAYSARLHYVMPEHHFPVGVTLSPARRAALLQLAEERDALILEDDYDSEFYYDRHPLPALKAQDIGGRVVYMGTFSKVLFNGLRLGYVVAHSEIIRRLQDIHWLMNRGTSVILQLWVAELLESGAFERHLRRMRVCYRRKRNLIAQYLQMTFPQWQWQLPQGGMQFWIELREREIAETVIREMRERGVRMHSGKQYYEEPCDLGVRQLILGFGAITEAEIHQAFGRLM